MATVLFHSLLKEQREPRYNTPCAKSTPHVNAGVSLKSSAAANIATTEALRKSMDIAIPPRTPWRPFPAGLTPLRSPEGFTALKNAESVAGFHSVAPVFQGQGPLQCAPTSVTVALNSLKLINPRSKNTSSYLRFDKDGIVGVLRSTLRPRHPFFSVSLAEIGQLAAHYTSLTPASRVRVSTVHANETTCAEFRAKAAATLRNGGMVVTNFSRSAAGYSTSPFAGHMSPIVAYNRDIDSFLVMDVAIKSWEPVWMPASQLFDAMNTTAQPRDASRPAKSKRGFILFERV